MCRARQRTPAMTGPNIKTGSEMNIPLIELGNQETAGCVGVSRNRHNFQFQSTAELVERFRRHRPAVRLRLCSDAIEFRRRGHLIFDITFDRCRTMAEALDWCRQLAGKKWVSRRLLCEFCTTMLRVIHAE